MNRGIDSLLPEVRVKAQLLIERARAASIPIMVTSALRTVEEQEALYAIGRSKPGNIVTKARGGQSWHNFGRAFDVAFKLQDGKLTWEGPWELLGSIGRQCELEWGGDWVSFKDKPHFQDRGGMTLAEARQKAGIVVESGPTGGDNR